MDVFLGEWVNLLLRWFHMIVGIGWIGTSFYFIALDYGLQKEKGAPAGVYGGQWQVHGGGFYRMQKYLVAPAELPGHLTWFKYEAYATWLSGFVLLGLIYYLSADLYLIDPTVLDLPVWCAILLPLFYVALDVYRYRGLRVEEYLTVRRPLEPLLLSLISFGVLTFRHQILQRVDRWFRRRRVRPSVYSEVPGREALLSLVALGCGVGIVPRLVVDRSPLREEVRALEVEPGLGEFRVLRREARERGLIQALRAALAGVGAERGEGSEQGGRHGGGLNEKLRGWAAQPVNSWDFKRLRESTTAFSAI